VKKNKKAFVILYTFLVFFLTVFSVKTPHLLAYKDEEISLSRIVAFRDILTYEEKSFIARNNVLKAAAFNGEAPFMYLDKNGELQGVYQRVLNRLSVLTGLKFEFELYDSFEDALKSDADIIYGINTCSETADLNISEPFLESEVIVYMNASLQSGDLANKRLAAVTGGRIPEGIKKENIIYYNTMEECLNAVSKGEADYGYGNIYSIAYYKLRNGYNNIISVPIERVICKYCIGFLNNDPVLISIINKGIKTIDISELQNFVLDEALRVDRKITLVMVMDTYGREIVFAAVLLIAILVIVIIFCINISIELREQNRRYEVLSRIANEYLYEFNVREKRLDLSDKFKYIFYTEESLNEAKKILKEELAKANTDWTNNIIRLPLPNGKTGSFKVINSKIGNKQGKTDYIIGKLIDVSDEIAEKEELLVKSQIDGLTGLYNAVTTKDLINKRIKSKEKRVVDALILLDCDCFKSINDTCGHLVGDQVLEELAKVLKKVFRSTDIVGRIGGDEFCIYLKDIPSVEFLREKCRKVSDMLLEVIELPDVSFSIGVSLIIDGQSYEEAFQRADEALYQAKRNGKSRVVISDKVI